MSPERKIFKALAALIELKEMLGPSEELTTVTEALKARAIDAFHEDHPEVRQLFFVKDGRLEVNLYGESAAYKYFHEELTQEHEKLKKCLEIMEDLFRKLG